MDDYLGKECFAYRRLKIIYSSFVMQLILNDDNIFYIFVTYTIAKKAFCV